MFGRTDRLIADAASALAAVRSNRLVTGAGGRWWPVSA